MFRTWPEPADSTAICSGEAPVSLASLGSLAAPSLHGQSCLFRADLPCRTSLRDNKHCAVWFVLGRAFTFPGALLFCQRLKPVGGEVVAFCYCVRWNSFSQDEFFHLPVS